jgi:hypothetical protein
MSIRSIDTTLAVVERDAEGVIHVRVKHGVKLNVSGFHEVLVARKELAEGRRVGVLVTVPDDVDFDIRILNVDHYAMDDPKVFTKAFAVVTHTSLYTKLFDLYAAYFKTGFPVRMFNEEAPALAWIRERTAEVLS